MQISIRMPKTIGIWTLISMMYFMLSCIGLSMKPVLWYQSLGIMYRFLLASWCMVYAVVMYNYVCSLLHSWRCGLFSVLLYCGRLTFYGKNVATPWRYVNGDVTFC